MSVEINRSEFNCANRKEERGMISSPKYEFNLFKVIMGLNKALAKFNMCIVGKLYEKTVPKAMVSHPS